jgi:hypothetical protein
MQKKYIYMYLEVKEKTRLVDAVEEAVEEYKIHRATCACTSLH